MFNCDDLDPDGISSAYRLAAADLYKDLCPMLSRQFVARIRRNSRKYKFDDERYCKFCSSIRTNDNHKVRIRPKTLPTKKLLALAACQVKSPWKISRKQKQLIQRCTARQMEMVNCCSICKMSLREKIIPSYTGPENKDGIKAGCKVKPKITKLGKHSKKLTKGPKRTLLQRISDVLNRKERTVERNQDFRKNRKQFSEKFHKLKSQPSKVVPQSTVLDRNVKMPATVQVSSIVEDKSKFENKIESRKKSVLSFLERVHESEDLQLEETGQVEMLAQNTVKPEKNEMDVDAKEIFKNHGRQQFPIQSQDDGGSSKNSVVTNAIVCQNAEKPIARRSRNITFKENNKLQANDPEYRKKILLRFFERLPKEVSSPMEDTLPQLEESEKATEKLDASIDTMAHSTNNELAEQSEIKHQLKMDENFKKPAKRRRIASVLKGKKDKKETNNSKLKKKSMLKSSGNKSAPAKRIGSLIRSFLSKVL